MSIVLRPVQQHWILRDAQGKVIVLMVSTHCHCGDLFLFKRDHRNVDAEGRIWEPNGSPEEATCPRMINQLCSPEALRQHGIVKPDVGRMV